MALCNERDKQDRLKVQKKADAAARKEAKEAERQCAARRPDATFAGPMGSKNKPNLQDITEALQLSKG